MNCPCQSGQTFDQCCNRFISHQALPENAEQLMRSRYTAFHQGERDYLLETWQVDHRPRSLELDSNLKWMGLEIIEAVSNGVDASIEFEARLLVSGRMEGMRELSEFSRKSGRWLYTSGVSISPRFKAYKPSRNETCPCGSGLKFKRCCSV
ncbi:MAG: YchJ family metal-binding protein [Pseudomonadota bacterium]